MFLSQAAASRRCIAVSSRRRVAKEVLLAECERRDVEAAALCTRRWGTQAVATSAPQGREDASDFERSVDSRPSDPTRGTDSVPLGHAFQPIRGDVEYKGQFPEGDRPVDG